MDTKFNIQKPNSVELSKSGDKFLEDLSFSREVFESSRKIVAIFGGGRVPEESPYFEAARGLASLLSSEGISIITGGGLGIMRAANMGSKAVDSSGLSYGLNVEAIVDELQEQNVYLDDGCDFTFNTLVIRLLTLISSSNAIVFFPGGFGTLEEMFCLLVRIKVRMMKQIPIYFYGSEFWKGLYEWLSSQVLGQNLIDKENLELIRIEDDIHKIAKGIVSSIA